MDTVTGLQTKEGRFDKECQHRFLSYILFYYFRTCILCVLSKNLNSFVNYVTYVDLRIKWLSSSIALIPTLLDQVDTHTITI